MAGFNEIREKVYSVIGDTQRTLITEDDVDLWVQEAMDDLATRLDLIDKEKTGTTSGNTIAIPADYADLIWLKILASEDHDDYVIFVTEDQFTYHDEAATDLTEQIGRVFNGNFEIYPTPTTGTAYTLRYFATTTDSLTDFNGSLKRLIADYAKAQACWKAERFPAGDRYMAHYEEGLPPPDIKGRNHRVLSPLQLVPSPSPFEEY